MSVHAITIYDADWAFTSINLGFFLSIAVGLSDHPCANRVATGAAVGGALGASIGTYIPHKYLHHIILQALDHDKATIFSFQKLSFFTSLAPPALFAGALYGTYEAFRYKVPGIYKIRYIGQTTMSSAAVSIINKTFKSDVKIKLFFWKAVFRLPFTN